MYDTESRLYTSELTYIICWSPGSHDRTDPVPTLLEADTKSSR